MTRFHLNQRLFLLHLPQDKSKLTFIFILLISNLAMYKDETNTEQWQILSDKQVTWWVSATLMPLTWVIHVMVTWSTNPITCLYLGKESLEGQIFWEIPHVKSNLATLGTGQGSDCTRKLLESQRFQGHKAGPGFQRKGTALDTSHCLWSHL